MGAILKILSSKELPQRELHNSRLFVDLSENVHIHFREIRLMFGVEEFFEFTDIIRDSAKEVKKYLKKHPEYKEQENFDGILVAGGLKNKPPRFNTVPNPTRVNISPTVCKSNCRKRKSSMQFIFITAITGS